MIGLVKFPLSEKDRAEIVEFQLRSSCVHCFFYRASEARCAHEWPSEEQEKWPLAGEDGSDCHDEISLCKEFELR